MSTVTLWFDFVSPYSWLALARAESFAREHAVDWRLRPIVFAAVLDATDLVGPGEVLSKRNGAMRDVEILAHDLGLRFTGPPGHPFRSLDALRTACLFQDRPEMLTVCRALFAAAWEAGRDLTDVAVLDDVLRASDVGRDDLASAIRDPAIKELLRANTTTAIERGVYGVPTFEADGELFWGQDRLDHVARKLAGALPDPSPALHAMLARPIATGRRRAPPAG